MINYIRNNTRNKKVTHKQIQWHCTELSDIIFLQK